MDNSSPKVEVMRLRHTPEMNDKTEVERSESTRWQLKWVNIISISIIHLGALYGIVFLWTQSHLFTKLFAIISAYVTGLGVTAGAHRLWTHRSYKATWQLNLLLAVLYSMTGMNSPYDWVRDHRVHHKFTETDADPHNAKRGFFFSHVGWLFIKKHPDVIKMGKKVDMSDIDADPFLRFQHRYYYSVRLVMSFLIPVSIPCYFWGESLLISILLAGFLRQIIILNAIWSVNSFAHLYGTKPYDKEINPAENITVAIFGMGEGWHNFHHVFPWDYKTGEYGNYTFNLTKAFIDMFASIGWAYDRKSVPTDIVKSRVERTGDGTHPVWGWGDKEMSEEDIRFAFEKKLKH